MQFTRSAAALLFASVVAVPSAHAVTLDLSKFERNDYGPGFWTSSETFNLSAGATGTTLNITGFAADDRAVLLLNGIEILSTAIFADGGGTGLFQYTAGGANVTHVFDVGGRPEEPFQPLNLVINSGFLTGTNTLSFIINDTYAGLNGDTVSTAGPTAFNFRGSVSFNVASAAPEPATWLLMIAGFGMVGGALRRRRAKVSVTYA